MAEKVGSIYFDLDLDDAKYDKKMDAADGKAKSFSSTLQSSAATLAALGAAATLALNQVVTVLDRAVDAAVKQQNALMGLSSVAKGTGNDLNATLQAAKDLSADGLMPLGDAAASLKNLLASGFSLPQAIKLMNAFKDSAAFGRQGSLQFGEAIVGATEGIKNGNSALVDNAGVTKNLSNILVDAGYSAQDLSKAGQDAGVRMALFNGILSETKNQTGDAAKLADSFGGGLARMNTQITNANVALGEALQPILGKIFAALAPLITAFTDFVKNNKELVAAIAAVLVIGLGLIAVLGLVGAVVGAIMTLGTVGIVAAAIAGAVALISGALIYLETRFGLVSKAIDWIKQQFDNFLVVVRLLWDTFTGGDPTLKAGEDRFAGLARTLSGATMFFQEFWKIIKQIYDFVAGQFISIWQSLQGIFKQLGDSLKPVFDALGKVFGAIGDFISKHSAVIMNVLKVIGILVAAIAFAPLAIAIGLVIGAVKVLAVVLGFINKHFEIIKKVVLTILAIVFAPLIIAIGLVVVAFKAMVWIVQTLWNVISTVFNAIWAVVSFVFNSIMLLWNTVLSPVFNAIIFILTSLFNIWWSIFTGILSIVTTIISTIAQIIFVVLTAAWNFIYNNFLQPIGAFFAAVFGAIWNVIKTVFDLILGAVTWYFNTVFGIIQAVVGAIWGFVQWAWNGIKNAIIDPIAAAVSAVWQKIVGVKDAVVDGVNKAWNWLKDKFNDFVNAGRDLINGLVNGIANAKDAVVNKVKEICNGALDAVKKFFGIHSPSRVMASMGDFLMQGFRNGIENAGDAVVNTATAIANRVSDGVNSGIDQVAQGTKQITGLYSGMYNNLNTMSAAGVAPLNASVAAMMNASNANEANGGAIAQAPITVIQQNEGIVARSRSEWRDIVADGIAAVNEDLQARGLPQIADGKVTGSSNV